MTRQRNRYNDPWQSLRDHGEARERSAALARQMISPGIHTVPDTLSAGNTIVTVAPDFQALVGDANGTNRWNVGDFSSWQQVSIGTAATSTYTVPWTTTDRDIAFDNFRYGIDMPSYAAAGMQDQISRMEKAILQRETKNEARYAEQEKIKAKYNAWMALNRECRAEHLNTHISYFRNQSIRSIELLLLEAITNKEYLKTKTTEYEPLTGTIRLLNESIAVIDTRTFQVLQVRLAKVIANQPSVLKLFRHRLRQLGVRCLGVRGTNRLFVDGDNYISLEPGETVSLRGYNKICLPEAYIEWTQRDIKYPQQLDLQLIPVSQKYTFDFTENEANETVTIIPSFNHKGWHCKGAFTIGNGYVELWMQADPPINANYTTWDILTNSRRCTVREWRDASVSIVNLMKNYMMMEIDKKMAIANTSNTYTATYRIHDRQF